MVSVQSFLPATLTAKGETPARSAAGLAVPQPKPQGTVTLRGQRQDLPSRTLHRKGSTPCAVSDKTSAL